MKTLKNYIAEAFRINKNTKIEKPNGNLFKLDYDLMKKDELAIHILNKLMEV